jgi:hypothetical protein
VGIDLAGRSGLDESIKSRGLLQKEPRMPRPLPLEDEAKIEELYLDETSQTGHRFLIFGGISVPLSCSKTFEDGILEARRPRLSAERSGTNGLRELKWKDVTKGDFDAHKRVIEAYFDCVKAGNAAFHCSVVLTHVKGRTFSGTRGKKGFDNEVFQHCLKMAIYHKTSLFHVYLDRRHSADEDAAEHDSKLRKELCSLLKHNADQRAYAVRRVKSRHSHEVQALQITDLLLGAVAFRLNRHYDADRANPDKRQLCEYILRQGGVWDHFNDERGTFREKTEGRFQVWVQRVAEAKRNPPARRKAS